MQPTLAESKSEVGAAKRAADNAGYDTAIAPNRDSGVFGVLVNGPDDAAFVMDAIMEELADRDVVVLFETFPLPRYLMHVCVTPVGDLDAETAENENANANAEAAR